MFIAIFLEEPLVKILRCVKMDATEGLINQTQSLNDDDDLHNIGGLLVKDVVECIDCKEFLTSAERTPFIHDKTYSHAHKNSLTTPSQRLI